MRANGAARGASVNPHFAAFSFVDRIEVFAPGRSARGYFQVPAGLAVFPTSLVAEAIGQLAAWVALEHVGFQVRPVAALARETRILGTVRPGDCLSLCVTIAHCDEHAVAYDGWAAVGGERVLELTDCLGPMLPAAQFDDPAALAGRLALLRAEGAPPGRFGGVPAPALSDLATLTDGGLEATLTVPTQAEFFGDHFPRRPVFPATLLLDALLTLAIRAAPAGAQPARIADVKVRSFTEPGAGLVLRAHPADTRDAPATEWRLHASAGGKTVASARLHWQTARTP